MREAEPMRFNPRALLVLTAFCLFVLMAVSHGSGWTSAGEAVATVLILLSLAGVMRESRRTG